MASIKVKFRPSTITDLEGSIYYQIIHGRTPRQLRTNHRVFASEWNEKGSTIVSDQKHNREPYIRIVRERIRRDLERLNNIIRELEVHRINFTADDIVVEFNQHVKDYSLLNFMKRIIVNLRAGGRVRTSETYTVTMNSFRKFLTCQWPENGQSHDSDILLDYINSDIMVAFEAWQKSRGNSPNTISFYMRILRAVYNRAVDEEVIDDRHPFRYVYTGVDKTIKRALPLQTIRRIKALDLTMNPELDYARDMFILSFMLRGMSFVDMAFLRKKDLSDGYVIYRRRKTSQTLMIEWTKEMQIILDKYPENGTGYLLPIIRNAGVNERNTYKNMGDRINRNLKKVAEKVDITLPLSLYVARHSWASIAKSEGVPLSLISAGLGHNSETTTQIYLSSLDPGAVDKANSMLINLL